MIVYLLKSALCLGILLAIYHVLLEREKMHRFNRYFLLTGLAFSFMVPFATYEVVIPQMADTSINYEQISNLDALPQTIEGANFLSTTKEWILLIYTIIAFMLGLRFSKNLLKLIGKAIKNPIKKWREASLVMLPEEVLPYSFLKYIFIENEAFQHKKIEEELLLHELEHVKQKHSLDIILIELLQIVFWFNPVLFFYKKAIKLNHEFLADTSVLNKHNDVGYYQQLLLAKTSFNTQNHLASGINYSVTKKRLQMMTKHTKKTRAWIKSVVLLPLFAILLYSFSEKVEVEEKNAIDQGIHDSYEDINLMINYKNEILINEFTVANLATLSERLDLFNRHLSHEERKSLVEAHITASPEVEMGVIFDVHDILVRYGVVRFVHHDKNGKPKPFVTDQSENEKVQYYRVQSKNYTNNIKYYLKYPSKEEHNKLVKSHEILTKHFNDFSGKEKKEHKLLPPPPYPARYQKKDGSASKTSAVQDKEITLLIRGNSIFINGTKTSLSGFAATLDRLTRKWKDNELTDFHFNVQLINVPNGFADKIDNEYKKTRLYKADPDGHGIIPPPPPAPPAPEMVEVINVEQEIEEQEIEEIIETPLVEIIEEQEVTEVIEIPMTPPPPPIPPVPSEHMKEMAKKGAVFYYEGKKISAKKAIKIAEENENINIQVKDHDSKKPIVKLSTKPIWIKQ